MSHKLRAEWERSFVVHIGTEIVQIRETAFLSHEVKHTLRPINLLT